MPAILSGDIIQTMYDEYVHPNFQSYGDLVQGRYYHKGGVIGNTCQFRVMNQVQAVQASLGSMVNPVNIQFDPKDCTLVNWISSDLIPIQQQTEVNFNLVEQSALDLILSINRRKDQIVIDALNATSTTNNVDVNVGGDTTFNYTKFQNGFMQLSRQSAVGRGMLTLLTSSEGQMDLLNEAQLTNTFFVDYKPIANDAFQSRPHVQDVMFIVIPNMVEGGLPYNSMTNTRTSFMFNSQALGVATADLPMVITSLENLYPGYLTNCLLKMGSVGIDPRGICPIHHEELYN